MIDRLSHWWATHSDRERWLVGVASALAVLILTWLLIIHPIDNMREASKARYDAAVMTLGRVEARLSEMGAVATRPRVTSSGAIHDLVRTEADRVGFTNIQTEAIGSEGVRVIITAVRAQAFFTWAADLETRLGLDVAALSARPNADETLSVEVTFNRRSRG